MICRCGETNENNFYPYRKTECKQCIRKRTNKRIFIRKVKGKRNKKDLNLIKGNINDNVYLDHAINNLAEKIVKEMI